MQLDHLSYVATHSQIADVAQRIGSQIGTAFIDGGVHPRFGTRNFTLPLKDNLYLEIVCPLDHPASDSSPFGRFVNNKAAEGGGWLTWVFSTDDISEIENKLQRKCIQGHRKKPDGNDLNWKQIGILDTFENPQLPYVIQWESSQHPSKDGIAVSRIRKIDISGDSQIVNQWLGQEIGEKYAGIEISWTNPESNGDQKGILSVVFDTPYGQVIVD